MALTGWINWVAPSIGKHIHEIAEDLGALDEEIQCPSQRDFILAENNPWFELYVRGTTTAGMTWANGGWASQEKLGMHSYYPGWVIFGTQQLNTVYAFSSLEHYSQARLETER